MNYASYKALCADPSIQADFLEKATAAVLAVPERDRYTKFLSSVTVAGTPINPSKYLVTLGMESDGWVADEFGEPDMRRMTSAVNAFTQACPQVQPGNFIFRFVDMPGAKVELVTPRDEIPQHQISTGVLSMSERLRASSDTFRNPLESERARMR